METSSPSTTTGRSSASPPPKCAICLGTCNNKCCSDSCRHHFCFTCLLQWSKVKAECPLCKQPFKSIIHNIKSTDEFERHFVSRTEEARPPPPLDEFLYLAQPPSRHYQFRTTFTVDPGGELAIQQMLETHPLTSNTPYGVPVNYVLPHQRYRRRHPRFSQIGFRSSIYEENLWVYAPPDITGRCRDTSPQFFRENEAARHRLVPWLNRELSALGHGSTLSVMYLVDMIMEHIQRWHIRSRDFKTLLTPFLHENTSHFIHEFYSFMRSPYDMIGYDRYVIYSSIPQSPTYSISDTEGENEEISVVSSQMSNSFHSHVPMVMNNPFRLPTLEVIEINSESSRDSDVIIREPTPPEVVDLLDTDSNDGVVEPERKLPPILPLKIRLKYKRQSREKKRRHHRHSGSDSSTSDDSKSSSSVVNRYVIHKKKKHKHKKSKHSKSHKRSHRSDSSDSSDECTSRKRRSNFDSDDNVPLSKVFKKELQRKGKCVKTITSSSMQPSCSSWTEPEPFNHFPIAPLELEGNQTTSVADSSHYTQFDYEQNSTIVRPNQKTEGCGQKTVTRVNASTSPINLSTPSCSHTVTSPPNHNRLFVKKEEYIYSDCD